MTVVENNLLQKGISLFFPAYNEAARLPATLKTIRDYLEKQTWSAEVIVVEPTGADTQVYCRLSGTEVTVVSRERHIFQPGETIQLQPVAEKTYLFDPASGKRMA